MWDSQRRPATPRWGCAAHSPATPFIKLDREKESGGGVNRGWGVKGNAAIQQQRGGAHGGRQQVKVGEHRADRRRGWSDGREGGDQALAGRFPLTWKSLPLLRLAMAHWWLGKKRMALAPIILCEGAHCQVRWKSNAKINFKKIATTVSLRPVSLTFLRALYEQRTQASPEKVWWIHLISTEARAYTPGRDKDTGTQMALFGWV